MSIQTIRTAIKAKLDEMVGTWQPFGIAYDYYTTKPTGYPCVMFEPTDLKSTYDSTCENQRNYSFDVFITQEMTEQNRQEAIDIVLTAFDKLINEFDKDYTLGGAILKLEAMPWVFWEANQDSGTVYYANIQINCTVLYNIKS